MTILLYARRKGWPLESVTVECSHERVHRRDLDDSEEREGAYISLIRLLILLRGDLSEQQRERIAWIAARCPVHRTLESRPRIEQQVELVPSDPQ